jgi:hypothetical protein
MEDSFCTMDGSHESKITSGPTQARCGLIGDWLVPQVAPPFRPILAKGGNCLWFYFVIPPCRKRRDKDGAPSRFLSPVILSEVSASLREADAQSKIFTVHNA